MIISFYHTTNYICFTGKCIYIYIFFLQLQMNKKRVYINPLVALISLCLLGLLVALLNLSALAIMRMPVKRKYFSYPLLWLTASNVLIGIFPLPLYGLKKYNFESSAVASIICDAWRYSYFVTSHISMITLVVMTLDKIISLTSPLRYKYLVTKLRINIILIVFWTFYAGFDIIPFFPISEKDKDNCHYYVKKQWAILMNIFTTAIPLPVIIMCYIYMTMLAYRHAVRKSFKDKNIKNTSFSHNLKVVIEVKATKKVSYIVTAYMICWMPSTIYYLLVWLCPYCFPKNYQPHKTWIRFFFKLLIMFHGFVTPILFCWQSKIFRKSVKDSINRHRSIFANIDGAAEKTRKFKAGVRSVTVAIHLKNKAIQQKDRSKDT